MQKIQVTNGHYFRAAKWTERIIPRELMRSSSSASQDILLHFMGLECSMQRSQHPRHVSWDRWSVFTSLSFLFKTRFNILILSMPISSIWPLFVWWLSEKRANSFSAHISCFISKSSVFLPVSCPEKFVLSFAGLFLVKMAVTKSFVELCWTLRDHRRAIFKLCSVQ